MYYKSTYKIDNFYNSGSPSWNMCVALFQGIHISGLIPQGSF